MRIGIISTMTTGRWGGSEELWCAMAASAIDAGHDVGVSVARWDPLAPKIERLRERGARVFTRPRLRRTGPAGVRIARVLRPFARLRRFRPDVILISCGATFDLDAIKDRVELERLLEELRVPYAIVCHGNADSGVPSTPSRVRLRRIFGGAAFVAFVSEYSLRQARRQLVHPIENGVIVKNPVNLDGVGELPWPRSEDLRLAFVGRIDLNKNLESLLEMLAAPSRRDLAWRLEIVGDGSHADYARELAAHLGLSPRVHFLGAQSDIRAVWARNHVLVLPSRAESMPIVMFEAMLCGRPVLATRVGGVPEVVTDGTNGFLASEPQAEALGEAFDRMWAGRASLEQTGRAAWERAISLYDPDAGGSLLGLLVSAAGAAGTAREKRA